VDVPDDSDAQPDSTTQHNHDKKNNNEQEFVIFKIKGYGEENVHMAFEHLDRIVKGDRIKDVMENLKVVSINKILNDGVYDG
jgi:chemotaxis signal transduction protein